MSKRQEPLDAIAKKILKLYANYGLDTSGMSEEELARLVEQYKVSTSDIAADLKESEKHSDAYSDNII